MDSADLLTTCAGSGATLVAIVGGFLLTRYLAIANEIQAADHVLHRASTRLAAADERVETARQRLAIEDLDGLFDGDRFVDHLLAKAEGFSSASIEEAKALLPLHMFRDCDIEKRLELWNQEARLATSSHIWSRLPRRNRYPALRAFAEPLGVDINIYPLWSRLYERQKDAKRAGGQLSIRPLDEIDVDSDSVGRRGRLEVQLHDASSHRMLMEAEAWTADAQRKSIQEPRGLRAEILLLSLIATLTMVPSLLFLTPQATTLSRGLGASVVILFICGFILLIAYLVRQADLAKAAWGSSNALDSK